MKNGGEICRSGAVSTVIYGDLAVKFAAAASYLRPA
jgi:hypothetical protein